MTFAKAWHQAEEITQDIFLNLWQKRDKLAEVDNLKNYIFIVSRNYLISQTRKNVHHFKPADFAAEVAQTSAAHYENKELGALLERAICHLPEQKRHVFRLIHLEGLSQKEVGLRLGIATRTVRWNLVSATNTVRDFLHRYYAGDLYLLFLCCINLF